MPNVFSEEEIIPDSDPLLRNYPNPFNPSTIISFQLSDETIQEDLELGIFNIKGQKVKKYSMLNIQYSITNDLYSVTWDGRDNTGKAVPSGIYLYRLDTGAMQYSRKMLLLK